MVVAGGERIGKGDLLRAVLDELEWRALRLGLGVCPLCAGRFFVRISTDLLGTRCLSCKASPISMAIGSVLERRVPEFARLRICELAARGPFVESLQRKIETAGGSLHSSEFWDDVAPGESRNGTLCQNVERLTYEDGSFDVCTSTEVFEHVPDDLRGFRELHRVLAPGGHLIFTVPMHDADATVERAERGPDGVRFLLPASYHDDQIRGTGRVLVFRDYGRDIVDRLDTCGFHAAELIQVQDPAGLSPKPATVVVATR